MKEIETDHFQFEGRRFELKLFEAEGAFMVIVLLDGDQVSPVYHVDYATHFDFFQARRIRLVDNLKWLARLDVEMGLYLHATPPATRVT